MKSVLFIALTLVLSVFTRILKVVTDTKQISPASIIYLPAEKLYIPDAACDSVTLFVQQLRTVPPSCCFQLILDNKLKNAITQIKLDIRTATFKNIVVEINSGWIVSQTPQMDILLSHNSGFIPVGGASPLSFCLMGGNSPDSLVMSYNYNALGTAGTCTVITQVCSDPLPCDAAFSGSTLGSCGNYQFINQSTGQAPLTYSWNFGDPGSGGNNTSTAQNPTHQFSKCGDFIVCLKTNSPGCIDSICKPVAYFDNVKPVITCPSNLNLQCNNNTNPPATGVATATDNCTPTNAIIITSSDVVTGAMPCNATITRTWQAKDLCGNISTCIQTIVIRDNVAPVIVCPPNLNLTCNTNINPPATGVATAIDNCTSTNAIVITSSDVVTGTMPCNATIVRTWQSKDLCGNISTCVQTIVIRDNVAPVIVCPPNLKLQCYGNVNPPASGVATATDNCTATNAIVITSSDVVTGVLPCNATITRTWQAKDACNNIATCTQTITIRDTIAPTIVCPSNLNLQCNANTKPPATGTATATDNCTPTNVIMISFTDVVTGSLPCNAIISRTWQAKDSCGNIATCVQRIIIRDTIAPTIVCPPNLKFHCNTNIIPPATGTATATDNCTPTNAILITFSDVVNGNMPCNAVVSRTWQAKDSCGNISSCVQTITFKDTIAPTIVCPPNTIVNTNPGLCYYTGTLPQPTGKDSCDKNLDFICSLITSGSAILITPQTQFPKGVNTITCFARDDCGNQSPNCNYTLTVVDNQPPTANCPLSMSYFGTLNASGQCKAMVNNIGPMAADNCPMLNVSYNITGATTASGINDVSGTLFMEGISTVTYTITDMAGHQITCSFDVEVVCFNLSTSPCPNNLVPNPSFESYTICPPGISPPFTASNWTLPTTGGSSDYYNSCAPFSSNVSTPGNSFGNQIPLTGAGYAGFILQPTNLYREYLEVQLISPLIPGKTYQVSFYVNLADYASWAIDKFGAYLSNIPIGPVIGAPVLPLTPQISHPVGNFITNKTIWTLVTGSYTAVGGESYLVIGNFYDNISTVPIKGLGGFYTGAYYYIDDVSVCENCTTPACDSCCTDSLAFNALVNQGFTVVPHDCGVTLTAPQFDSCYLFTTPPVADGGLVSQVITDPGGTWTFNFTQSGTHQICVTVFDECQSRQMCTTVKVNCAASYCDSISFWVESLHTIPPACCFRLHIENKAKNEFIQIPIDLNTASFNSISVDNLGGWVASPSSLSNINLTHASGFIPLGNFTPLSWCINNGSNPDTINIKSEYLNGHSKLSCDTSFAFFCPPQPDTTCGLACVADSISLNTGFDPGTGQLYSAGSYDPFWTITQTPYTNLTLPRPGYVLATPWWWDDQPNALQPCSKWISLWGSYSFITGNYQFTRCFCICKDGATVQIHLSALADDAADFTLCDSNGITIAHLLAMPGTAAGTFHNPPRDTTLQLILNKGKYCIKGSVYDIGSGAMGLNVCGSIKGDGLVKEICCEPSAITGVKYVDTSCAAVPYNGTQQTLQGWQIVLCNSSTGIAIDTVTTDQNGYYNFSLLPPGLYTVKELNQPGWIPSLPATGSSSIFLGANQVAQVNFANCPPEIDSCCKDRAVFIQSAINALQLVVVDSLCKATVSIKRLPPCDSVFLISWGDGQVELGPFNSGMWMHTYTQSGNYTIQIPIVEFDANGSPCFDTLIKFPIDIHCQCECGKYALNLQQNGITNPVQCNDTVILGCPSPKPLTLGGIFSCAGDSCQTAPILWTLTGPGVNQTGSSFSGNIQIPLLFPNAGWYTLNLQTTCGKLHCFCQISFFQRPCPVVDSCLNYCKTNAWSTMSNSWIEDMIVYQGKLIVAGSFSTIGNPAIPANNIAAWDGTNWTSLGAGLDKKVNTLAIHNGILYAGGEFNNAGAPAIPVNKIAAWNGINWTALNQGINTSTGVVSALLSVSSGLVVGGSFSSVGNSVPASNIAFWTPGPGWSLLGGLNGPVKSLALYNGSIIAGGLFGNVPGGLNNIARWVGNFWAPLAGGVNIMSPLNSSDGVYALAQLGNDLIVGGQFLSASPSVTGTRHLAKWDGNSWSGLGGGVNTGNGIYELLVNNSELLAGGRFSQIGNQNINSVATWNGNTWSGLGHPANALVYALALYDNPSSSFPCELYAGGEVFLNQLSCSPVIMPPKCDSVSASLIYFQSAIHPCNFQLIIDNQASNLNKIQVDFKSISSFQTFAVLIPYTTANLQLGSNSFTLHNTTSPIPKGKFPAVQFDINGGSNPDTAIIKFFYSNGLVSCDTSIIFNCPLPPPRPKCDSISASILPFQVIPYACTFQFHYNNQAAAISKIQIDLKTTTFNSAGIVSPFTPVISPLDRLTITHPSGTIPIGSFHAVDLGINIGSNPDTATVKFFYNNGLSSCDTNIIFNCPVDSTCGYAPSCATNNISLNTGVGPNGQLLPPGAFDPNWTVIQTPYTGLILPRPAEVVVPYSSWALQPDTITPCAQWISVFQGANKGSGPRYTYSKCFCVCKDNSPITIQLSALADNEADFWLYDASGNIIATLLGVHPIGNNSSSPFALPPDTSTTQVILNKGTYCIRAGVKNWTRVTGINVCGSITGPGLIKADCCETNSYITGIKYKDTLCDGKAYSGQPKLSGWQIILCDATGNAIDTVTTDASGYYSFGPLKPDKYSVKEINQPGWMLSNPLNNMVTVQLDTHEVQSVNFGNCPPTTCDSISYWVESLKTIPPACCFRLHIVNQVPNTFTQIPMVLNTASFNSISVDNIGGWFTSQSSLSNINLTHSSGFIPVGSFTPLSWCINNGSNPDTIKIKTEYLIGTSTVSCDTSFVFFCPPQPDTTCGLGCKADTISLSTGLDHSTGQFYPAGSPDAFWTVTKSPYPLYILPKPAYVLSTPTYWQDQPSAAQPCSKWINFSGGPYHYDDSVYEFSRCFCICKDGARIQIHLSALADNAVDFMLCDSTGTVVANLLSNTSSYSFLNPAKDTTVNLILDQGRYCIKASVYNYGHTYTGLNVCGSISGTGLVKEICCEPSSLIGIKYVDSICAGLPFNGTQQTLQGWQIVLCNSQGVAIDTVITDVNGSYSFSPLIPGLYTVKELNQYGWNPSFPASGMSSIFIGANQVAQVNFGNCPPEVDSCCKNKSNFIHNVINAIQLSVIDSLCKAKINVLRLPPCDSVLWIDWGDGDIDDGPGSGGMAMHTYAQSGQYTIQIPIVEFDSNHKACFDTVLKFTIDLHCTCECGRFTLTMPQNGTLVPVHCNDTVTLGCPAPGGISINGNFVCAGDSCFTPLIQWALIGSLSGLSGNVSPGNFQINLPGSLNAGYYTLNLQTVCGMQKCTCKIVLYQRPCALSDSCTTYCPGTFWNQLNTSWIQDMVVYQGRLIAAGSFNTIGNPAVAASNIAAWNGTTWAPLAGGGLNNIVNDIEVHNGILYAGGEFTIAGNTPASKIASWNGISWSAIPQGGINGAITNVDALLSTAWGLVVGGKFNSVGTNSITANNIARWNPGPGWATFGSGFNGPVFALSIFYGNIVAGGRFGNTAGGFNNLAIWVGYWTKVGVGGAVNLTVNPPNSSEGIYAIASYKGQLIAAGQFPSAVSTMVQNGNKTQHIAMWNGAYWTTLGIGPNPPGSGVTAGNGIYALKVINNELFVGGQFTQVNNQNINLLAKWDGSTWTNLNHPSTGIVRSIALYNPNKDSICNLYTGGEVLFNQWKCSGVSTKNQDPTLSVTIYPNPTADKIYIQFNEIIHEEVNISMYSLWGQRIWNEVIPYYLSRETRAIETNNFSSGTYLIKVSTKKGLVVKKITVMK